MGEPSTDIVISWLRLAKRNLDSARRLATGPEPYLDTAIYHCQQAAEKAVKGVLVFHNREFPRTHDIRKAVALAESINPRFAAWLFTAELLTPHATAFRDTDDILEPTQGECDQALQSADNLYAFVLSLLPDEVQPAR